MPSSPSSHRSLRNIGIIMKREYLERVRTKAFLWTTLLMPAILFAVVVLPSKLAMRSSGVRNIVVVSSTPQSGAAIRDVLQDRNRGIDSNYSVSVEPYVSDTQKEQLKRRVISKEIDGYLWATDDMLRDRRVLYVARETSDFTLRPSLESAVSLAMMKQRLATGGMTGDQMDDLFKRINVEVVDASKGSQAAGLANFFGAFMMVMVMYTTTLIYGIAVMRSVLEEKTSRIMEVLLSTATATEMMAGKIIGVGAVGLTQLAIWVAVGAFASFPAMMAASSVMKTVTLSPATIVFFVVFFLLGYFLYSTIYAALGAMSNSEQEAQSLQFIVMLPLIASTAVMMFVIRNPNAPMSVGLSLFPFCAPLIMYLRIAVQQPPAWQIALSIAILLATIYGMVLLCSRIYRVGILMYGKRPTLPEIRKWLRYA